MIDVLVAGGGSAGVAAAVASAKTGASTLLVERAGVVGGMSALALVHTICGLYELQDELRFANGGFAQGFASRLLREGGAIGPVKMGKLWVMPHDPSAFATLSAAYLRETPNLKVWLETEITAVRRIGSKLTSLEIRQGGEPKTVEARSFVDATGDATVVALANAEFEQSESALLQRPAFITRLLGLPAGTLDDEGRLRVAHLVATGVREGVLPPEAMGASFRSAIRGGEAFVTVDLSAGGEAWEPTSPAAIAEVERTGRCAVESLLEYLRDRLSVWNGVSVAEWPARPGVRESRRMCGVAQLDGRDVLAGVQCDDGIAAVSWPMELRERATGPRWCFPESDAPALIPLRALRHRDVDNLWVAGRCISCDHEAQASIRVMGTCMATGEAAGFAAALNGEDEPDWPILARRIIQKRDHVEYR